MSASENAATVFVDVVVKGAEAREPAESEGCKSLKKCIGVKGQVGELIAIVWLKLEQRIRQLSREVGVGSKRLRLGRQVVCAACKFGQS